MPTPIPAPASDLPSLRVARPLPGRRYVPGLYPHPSHGGGGGADVRASDSAGVAFDRGLDLLCHRFPWEAHEALEHAWKIWKAQGDPRMTTAAGLIQVVASWLRAHAGDRRAARRLLERASDKLVGADLPFDVAALLRQSEGFVEGGPWPMWPFTEA